MLDGCLELKHHNKTAILHTIEISQEEYLSGQKLMQSNQFFKVHSIQEQKRYCGDLSELLVEEYEYQDNDYISCFKIKGAILRKVLRKEQKHKSSLYDDCA